MSNYDDDQSEDGELARSPLLDEMDFSLSDEDRDNADSLVIKPPQAVIQPSHREKRAHKRSVKDRYKEGSRKDKKHIFRERDKSEKIKRDVSNNPDRDEMVKDYYREKQYYREKEAYRDKTAYRDKDMYREKDVYREKEMYRDNKEVYREKEVYRDREVRDKELYKDKDSYREREHYRERELYRDNSSFRETTRNRDAYRDKEVYKEKDMSRDGYLRSERQYKYTENERKRSDNDRIESRLRLLAEESHSTHKDEKENSNLSRSSGDKELEDLRSRLLSKRISKEIQGQEPRQNSDYLDKDKPERHSTLDKQHQERRRRLIDAEREKEKRKHESRIDLEARREERRRRTKKRSMSLDETSIKKIKTDDGPDFVVTVSDASDVEMKSDTHSEQEDGEHTNSETEEESSLTESDSVIDSKSEEEEDARNDIKSDKEVDDERTNDKPVEKSKSPTPNSARRTPSSNRSRRSLSRSKSRSRSHSFSPPPTGENGKSTEQDNVINDDETTRIKEEEINSLPPYYPALQGCRSVEEFQCLNRIEEGTYGVVYRARDKTTEEIVALKRLKMEKEKEGFPITSLREINTLLKARHLRCDPIARVNNFDTRAGLSIL